MVEFPLEEVTFKRLFYFLPVSFLGEATLSTGIMFVSEQPEHIEKKKCDQSRK